MGRIEIDSTPGGAKAAAAGGLASSAGGLAAAAGALVGAVYLGVALFYGDGGGAAVVRPDAYIYHQYARALAEGRPYQFAPGDAPSTGATSHLYSLMLGVLYAVGARGGALSTVALALNVAAFAGFLALTWIVARRLHRESAPLAVALVALSGQTAISALDQSEMGLFMLLSMGALAAAIERRYVWLAVSLALATLCRPEGLLLSIAVAGSVFIPGANEGRKPLRIAAAGAAGLTAFVAVSMLNIYLTGRAMPQSVLGKGLSQTAPLSGVVLGGVDALAAMVRGALFGATSDGRRFFVIPVIGGLLGVIGLISRDWKEGETEKHELWWWGAALAALAMISISGWDGVLFDRYLAWVLPIWLIYVAIGAHSLGAWLQRPDAYRATAVALVLYQCVGAAYFGSAYAAGGARTGSSARFAARMNEMMPEGSRVGMAGASGLAYMLPNHAVQNVFGVVSPEFAHEEPSLLNAELLKHRPELRFDFWLMRAPQAAGEWFAPFVGEQLAAETPAFGGGEALALHRATWATLEGPMGPRTTETLRAVQHLELVDAIDIGYRADEARADYSIFDRVAGAKLQPAIATLRAGEGWLTEVGRVAIGAESFTVRARPGRPMHVVMRTASSVEAAVYDPTSAGGRQSFHFVGPIDLLVSVGDRQPIRVRAQLAPDRDAFSEISFDLHPDWIDAERVRLTVGGDHVSFAYWIYQPAARAIGRP